MSGSRVLLVYSHYSSFVRNDHDILAEEHDVEHLQIGWHPRLGDRLRDTHRRLWDAIGRNDQVYWWFLSDYAATGAAMAKARRKRFVAVAGGWDVAAEPEVGYGRLIGGRVARTGTRAALRLAECVLTVSPLNDEETVRAGRTGPRLLVPNGVDVDRFRPADPPPPDPDGRPAIVAIGALTPSNHDVKGQWIFAEASKQVPEADFYLIGAAQATVAARLAARGGPNLKIPDYLPGADMLALLQRAKVVCQLSWHESFGMGLVEAVSCGCVPVYCDARIGAAAYLEGFGHTVRYGDIEATAEAIRRALMDAAGPGCRSRAHAIIRRNIPLERRRHALLRVMAGRAQTSPTEERPRTMT